ncbi:MAG TPA: nucleoside hydrolase [Actinomycetaceae bacterium]|nr:nucleoside hydrolase [Actinomycetaceae bacterium]
MTPERPNQILLDCDPGHDDALAILVAAGLEGVDVRSITTVGGNQTLDLVTRNALAVCAVAGYDAGRHPVVAAGHAGPFLRELVPDPRTHGATGLDGPELPPPSFELDPRHGTDVIVETIMDAEPGTVTLVPCGPLTNVAAALRREPGIAKRVREVVLMGGGYTRGNVTAAAEFNIWCDPEAASIVFCAPWPLTMVGLEVTQQALATPAVRDRIRDLGNGAGRFVSEMLDFFAEAYRVKQGFASPPVHDVVALLRAIEPGLVPVTPATVRIELRGEFTRGMTVTDFHGRDEHGVVRRVAPRHQVATGLDFEGFWDSVLAALARLP